MDVNLIKGEFSANDTLELITKMIQIKIKYHEDKISEKSSEEDIIYRESKIKQLQKELFELRQSIHSKNKKLKVEAIIHIE